MTKMEQMKLYHKRAVNCQEMYDALTKSHPGLIHEWNRSHSYVMWGWIRHYGWNEPVTEELLEEWRETIEWHEKRLEDIARRISEGRTAL